MVWTDYFLVSTIIRGFQTIHNLLRVVLYHRAPRPKRINEVENYALLADVEFLSILHPTDFVIFCTWIRNKTQFLHNLFIEKLLLTIIFNNQMQPVILYRYLCMEQSFSFLFVNNDQVHEDVKVNSNSVEECVLDSMITFSVVPNSRLNICIKNLFQSFHQMPHSKLNYGNDTTSLQGVFVVFSLIFLKMILAMILVL